MLYLILILFVLLLVFVWGTLKKVSLFGNVITPLLKFFAFFTYVLGFGYGYIISNCYAKSLKIWFEAFAVGSILIVLSEFIRLLRK